jgi:hypothetical protein
MPKPASVAPAPNEPRSNLQRAVLKAFETGKVPNYLKRLPNNANNNKNNNNSEITQITDKKQLKLNHLYEINGDTYEFVRDDKHYLAFQNLYTKSYFIISDLKSFDCNINNLTKCNIYTSNKLRILDTNALPIPGVIVDNYHQPYMKSYRKKTRKTRKRTRY